MIKYVSKLASLSNIFANFNSNYSMRVKMHTRVISVHLENIVCLQNNVFVFIKQIKKSRLCSLLF